jgi:hypothetical protein
MPSHPEAKDVTSSRSVPVCSAILGWAREQGRAMMAPAMQ